MKKKGLVAAFLIIICVLVGVFFVLPLFSVDGDGDLLIGDIGEPELQVIEPIDISILCTGDVMAHSNQVKAQAKSDGTYDFLNNFEYVKPYISGADLAICNMETTFGGTPYSGYPAFSSPDELAFAVADAGFDMVSTANNHMLDRGGNGLRRTLEVLQNNGLKTTGSVFEPGDPRYAICNVKGVNIGLVAYTYQNSTNSYGSVSINGSIVNSDNAARINSFNYNFLDREIEKIGDTVQACRDAGAQIVIMFYHWGEEYQLSANKWQREMAQRTIDEIGVDMIFGSHPHVLQDSCIMGRDVLMARDAAGNIISKSQLGRMLIDEEIVSDAAGGNAGGAPYTYSEYVKVANYAIDRYVEACVENAVAIPFYGVAGDGADVAGGDADVAGGDAVPASEDGAAGGVAGGDADVAGGDAVPASEDGAAPASDAAVTNDGKTYEEAAKELGKGVLPKGVFLYYGTKQIPVFYSLGNAISNQRSETLDNKYTEEGVLARVNLRVLPTNGEIVSLTTSVIPTWVDRYSKGGVTKYYIVPLDENLESNPALLESGHMSRAKDAKECALKILGY